MDLDFAVTFLLGSQLMLLQLCASQTNICSYGDIRLVNGAGPYEGRVEICLSNGVWKTVCDDSWSNLDAKVVCAQLNYPRQDALALHRAAFGQGSGSILEHTYCGGSEVRLVDCHHLDSVDNYNYCNHAKDAGVRCLSCHIRGAVRLRGSSSQYSGRVEICVNGVWGTVCDDSWDSIDASVVCKQLGYSRFGSGYYRGAHYGRGRGPIHLDDVRCTGNEQHLIECVFTNNTLGHNCTHREDASVYCQQNLQCQENDLRLTGGSTNQGRVEVCVNETWGTICATSWGQSDATVTCRQLGFSGYGATVQSIYGSGSGPVHFSNILCNGRESRLTHCQRDRLTGSCYGHKAGVHCSLDYLPSPTRFQVTCSVSNLCTLSWQPPLITNTRRHGTISYYYANCSTMGGRRDDHMNHVTASSTRISIKLQPYLFYKCCVVAENQAGRGNSSCQIIITHEAVPTAPPTNTEAYQLNSTSAFLSWRPPFTEYRNGIIRGYYVEFTEINSTKAEFQHITQNQHLLLDNLQPDVTYAFRVAAYTVGRGPFSEIFMIVLNSESEEEKLNAPSISAGSSTAALVALSTLLIALILIVGVYLAVQISYKLFTRKKSRNVYDTIQDPKPRKAEIVLKERSNHTCIARQNECDYRDGSITPPLPPRAYSVSSSLDRIDNLENIRLQDFGNQSQLKDQIPKMDHESTYQPLIPPRSTDASTGCEYQSLTQLKQHQDIETKL